MSRDLRQNLQELSEILEQERECARQLDMRGLNEACERKATLLARLGEISVEAVDDDLRSAADQVAAENRRNAFLLWSSLRWIRDTMDFYCQQLTNPSYTGRGEQAREQSGSRLLSGKI